MESKTKHRILGFLVIGGLIVILLPFFQRGKDISPETAMIQPPAFPDQSMQRGLNANNEAINEPEKPTTQNPSTEVKPLPIVQKTADEIVREHPDETINTSQAPSQMISPILEETTPASEGSASTPETAQNNAPSTPLQNEPVKSAESLVTEKQPTDTQVDTNADVNPLPTKMGNTASIDQPIPSSQIETPANEPESAKSIAPTTIKHASKAHIKKKLLSNAKHKLTHRGSYLHLPIDNNGLANINSSAWVIQVGSYKNKANALRVVNRLRANGYRAFIQQVSTSLGKNTRVFVGPENKQSSAKALAQDLESSMHLQSIVISYKPLAS